MRSAGLHCRLRVARRPNPLLCTSAAERYDRDFLCTSTGLAVCTTTLAFRVYRSARELRASQPIAPHGLRPGVVAVGPRSAGDPGDRLDRLHQAHRCTKSPPAVSRGFRAFGEQQRHNTANIDLSLGPGWRVRIEVGLFHGELMDEGCVIVACSGNEHVHSCRDLEVILTDVATSKMLHRRLVRADRVLLVDGTMRVRAGPWVGLSALRDSMTHKRRGRTGVRAGPPLAGRPILLAPRSCPKTPPSACAPSLGSH